MDFPPRTLPNLAPAYPRQLEPLHTVHHNALSTQQLYGSFGADQTAAFALQVQFSGGQVATMQNYAPRPFNLYTAHPSHGRFDIGFAGNSQSASASASAPTAPAGHLSSIGPPARPRKRKAATLRAHDWKRYEKRILDLHIVQKLSLPKVRQMIEEEYGFKAELRQYRTRVSQWGKDKKIKLREMKAIVRKRLKRKLVETNKGPLVFEVRGSQVEPQKIERWMKRHNVAESFLYAPSPAASTPSAVGCHTISERGSPAPSPTAFGSDREMSPTAAFAQDMILTTPEVSGKVSCMLPWWAAADIFMFQDLPWVRFHSLLFSFDNTAFAESATRDTLKSWVPDQSSRESSRLVVNASERTDIAHIFRKQRRCSLNLDEVMPECFRIHVSLGSQMESTLSKHSSTIQFAETGLFLVANSLLDGSSLVDWAKHILGKENDSFFKQLFKLPSSTVHSFTCRLLESLSGSWCDIRRIWRLLEDCSLVRTMIAGPTGGRCLQLAISHRNNWLALVLIKNGAPRNPTLGSKEPFNQTPAQLARLHKLQDVLDALLGKSSSYPKPPEPPGSHSVRRLQKKERTEGEIALEKAIEAKDTQKIHSLLADGLDIDSARNLWDDLILEWTFFQKREYYDIILPYSRSSDHSCTVPGIISAAISSEELEVYLRARTGKVNGEFEGEEGDDEYEIWQYEMEKYNVLGRSIELALVHGMTHVVQTILSLDWIRDELDLHEHLLNAANSWNLDLMVELIAYGADCTILEEADGDRMDECLADVLVSGLPTGNLQKVLKIGWFSLGDIFALNIDLTCSSTRSFDAVKNVQVLIDHGLDLDSTIWPKGSYSCYTPLQYATQWGLLEVVRCLADAGADISGSTNYPSYTALGEAVRLGELEIVRFLIGRGADLEKFANNEELTLVELAACYEEYDEYGAEIFKLLLESGANINGPNHRSPGISWNTALTRAILNSREHEMIYFAIGYGADIQQIGGGKDARTPLQAAAEKGDVKIVNELLERGAWVNAPGAPDHGRTALQAACESAKRSEVMISLLIDNGADVSALPAPRYGRTALQALCCSENPDSELTALLINRGADINAPAADLGGLTALQGAALMGNLRIAILLVENGATVNAPPSQKEGRMALDGAAEYGRLDTVQFLLTFGAECMAPGRSGYDSAIKFAEDNGHFAIADVLRGYNRLG